MHLDNLRNEAARYGLTFGPDPATHDHNTLGGMIGNNSGGVHAVMNGITVHNVHALEILTYDGLCLTVGETREDELRAILLAGDRRAEIYQRLADLRDRYGAEIRARFPQIPRRVSGYENLDQLFPENGMNVARALVGTEGTCVVLLEATLNLIPNPSEGVIVIAGFPDIFQAADAVPSVLEHKPIGLEGFDAVMVNRYKRRGMHARMHESGQSRRSVSDHVQSSSWAELSAANPGDVLPVSEGGRLRSGGATLRRRREVPTARRHDEVMCPSYLVTHEERYSTRGRARLLFEMLHGGPIDDGWRSAEVEEALDLCLACKGCKSDCPVNVDMASYKAEFRTHHYAWRLRPRHAYAMGWIHWLHAAPPTFQGPRTLSRKRRSYAVPPSAQPALRPNDRCRPSQQNRSQPGSAVAHPAGPTAPASCSGPTPSIPISVRKPQSPPLTLSKPPASGRDPGAPALLRPPPVRLGWLGIAKRLWREL